MGARLLLVPALNTARLRWLLITTVVVSLCPASLLAKGFETLCISTDSITIEIKAERAKSNAERARGLMGRSSLAPAHGMLFVYQSQRPPESAFWMRNTLIPLDIAYIGSSGDIRAIHPMKPCTANNADQCRRYPAGVHYIWALEMNQGFFADKGITVGDKATLPHNQSCAP